MKKYIWDILLCIAISFVVGIICYNTGKSAVYSSHNEYFFKTEALLDSICETYKDSFHNTMQTDTYYEYEVARANFVK